MKEQLEDFIRRNLQNPRDVEIKAILEIFQLKHFQKGDYFKHEDRICRRLGFILEGSMQHYVIKNNGTEVTLRVSKKDSLVTELLSMRTREKTPISIKTLEPTTMLVAAEEDINRLTEVNLTLNRLLREHMAESVEKQAKLYLLFLTGTAQERYQFIIENNPELLKKFPLRFIATMIGITPTQLSRIRNKKQP